MQRRRDAADRPPFAAGDGRGHGTCCSNTLSEGKICATWNEREMPSRVISRDGLPVMSSPSNRMVPLVGVRWPVIMLMKVVLPAPLAPMTPTVCSAGTLTVMSRAATSEPKVFSRSRTARMSLTASPPRRA